MLGSQVSDQSANAIIAQLLYLKSANPTAPIHFYINSPGGSVTAGMAIYDTIQMLDQSGIKVHTYSIGLSASMGAILLSGGSKDCRHALPNARIMIHQPLGGASGQASDILINAREIERWRDILYKVLAKHSNQPYERIFNDCERDNYMTAEQAKAYGLVDDVLSTLPQG
jgi:ATP-dependent Clp protease, protease subunit